MSSCLKRTVVVAFLFVLLSTASTVRAAGAEETAVTDALMRWTAQFNAGDANEICTLFDPDLRYDYRGHPERGFEDICRLLRRSLNDRAKTYSYELQIKEILVSGDLAVVRLVWKLRVAPVGSGVATVSEEPGMDIFRKQPDGSWKIIRYIAYEN